MPPTEPRPPRPRVTLCLILLNLLCYAATAWLSGGVQPSLDVLALGGKLNLAVLSGQWWRLVTSCCLHAGLIHLALNMYVLWSVGSLVEPWFSAARTFVVYTIAGICGGLASTWFGPELSVGASGAVLGLIGAGWMMSRLDRELPAPVREAMGKPLLSWLVLNLILGATIPLVDNSAHLGGVAGGLLAAALLHPRPLRRLAPALAVLLLPPLAYAGWLGAGAMTLRPELVTSPRMGVRLPVPVGTMPQQSRDLEIWGIPGIGLAIAIQPLREVPAPEREAAWVADQATQVAVAEGPQRIAADGRRIWWLRLGGDEPRDIYFWLEDDRGWMLLCSAPPDSFARYAPAFRRAALGLEPLE